ncbi:MAG: hypothetical protein IJ605_03030 [Prevotella sp.]|nr:hypothetical protein [Prevotella sp.]
MKRLKILILAAFAMLSPTSCGDVQSEFSTKPCYFVLDNAVHNDAILAAAMTPNSGVFTTVTQTMRDGARYFRFTSNQGTSSETIFNAIDQRRTLHLGMNNGLIVGYGNQTDHIFYAYDRECPNCFDDARVPIQSHALQTTSNGMAVCNTCHREYDMNYGGHIVKGDGGKKLERYPASTSGPYGELKVINMI